MADEQHGRTWDPVARRWIVEAAGGEPGELGDRGRPGGPGQTGGGGPDKHRRPRVEEAPAAGGEPGEPGDRGRPGDSGEPGGEGPDKHRRPRVEEALAEERPAWTPPPAAGPRPPVPRRPPDVHESPTASGPAAPAYPRGSDGPVAPRAPLPPPAPAAPGGWFAQDRPPPPMPGGVTWAHAATQAGPPPPPAGPLPPAGHVPGYAPGHAPGQVFGGPPPPEQDRSTRLLLIVTAVVVLIAAGVTLGSLRPWEDDGKAAPAAAASTPAGPGEPSGARQEDGPGGDSSAQAPAAPAEPSATTSEPASPSADPAAQARAVDALLGRSAEQRGTVQAAVNEVSRCGDTVTARQQLLGAAGDRAALVRDLDGLGVDAIPDAGPAIERLRTAWTESEAADRAYAAWALSSGTTCPGDRANYEAGNAASERATAAKQAFVALWNPIAARYGLTTRTAGEI